MMLREQIAAMVLACLLALFIAICLLLQSGCMSSRGVEEMNFSIPAVFQFEMEFNDEQSTALDVGAPLGFDGLPLLAPAKDNVVPVE